MAGKGIVIVANRLPVNRVRSGSTGRWDASPGGLVTAMRPVLLDQGGAWVGWTGSSGERHRGFTHDGIQLRPVHLTANEVESYYAGFSNRTIWPLFHDALRTPVFHRTWWKSYVNINRRFAEAADKAAGRGQIVWIHDYHLLLAPAMLRKIRPDLRIGFFLHIPFPPDEIFAWLPWRREIIEGMLGADVVGFQTPADAEDFHRAARNFTDCSGPQRRMRFEGRAIRAAAYPISIDFATYEELARSPTVQRRARELRGGVGASRKMFLAIDRLDYTKGIDVRLTAFEELLARGLTTARDSVLVQIAVPSRENVAEYREIKTQVEQMVGRINGDFSTPGRIAVHYFRRSLSREDVVAYYLTADVMVVTPLRDGMNLVAKEYVACRTDDDGALVLSEFAGAAIEMEDALVINPRDIEGTVKVLDRALRLPREESKRRMRALRSVVRRHDVRDWAESFLESLRG